MYWQCLVFSTELYSLYGLYPADGSMVQTSLNVVKRYLCNNLNSCEAVAKFWNSKT
jgi:hypothetical protein